MAAPPGPASPTPPPPPSFAVKRVRAFGRDGVPIVLQNENGPCPLLAIANCLLLRGAVELPAGARSVSQDRLIQLVAGHLLDANSEARLASRGAGAEYCANVAANVSDAMARLPKLATGIDVNVRFGGVRSFEFTDEVAIFDLLDVGLVHAWTADPNDPFYGPVARMSYNEAVELALCCEDGADGVGGGAEAAPALAAPASATPATAAPPAPPAPPVAPSAPPLNLMDAPASPLHLDSSALDTPPNSCVSMSGAGTGARGSMGSLYEAGGGPSTLQPPPRRRPSTGLDDLTPAELASALEVMLRARKAGAAAQGGVASEAAARRPAPLLDAAANAGAPAAVQSLVAVAMAKATAAADGGPAAGGGCGPAAPPPHAPPASERAVRALAARAFLEATPDQATAAGLAGLREALAPGEVAVLFRNNHFSTIFARPPSAGGGLFTLVTDLGYERMSDVVWESLDSVRTTALLSAEFEAPAARVTAHGAGADAAAAAAAAAASANTDANPSADADLALALALQEEEEAAAARARAAAARDTSRAADGGREGGGGGGGGGGARPPQGEGQGGRSRHGHGRHGRRPSGSGDGAAKEKCCVQ